MDYDARVNLFIRYLYETGVESGRYLAKVPYMDLALPHRKEVEREAKQLAKTLLLPQREFVGDAMRRRWVLMECKKRGVLRDRKRK